MIRNLLLGIILILFLSSCRKSNNNFEIIIPSSDAKTHLYFSLNDGEPYYLVYYNNDILVDWSMLGIIMDDTINFYEGLLVKNIESRAAVQNSEEFISDSEVPLGIYNEIVIDLEKVDFTDIQLTIVCRVYNNVVAYKYLLKNLKGKSLVTEISQLDLYTDLFSQVKRKNPEQDSINNNIIPIEAIDTLNLPVTFVSEKGYELDYFQSGSDDYPSMKLLRRVPGKLEYSLMYASGEVQSISVDSSYESPWRMINITNNQNNQDE